MVGWASVLKSEVRMPRNTTPFPVLRCVALAWIIVWLPAYVRVWGWANLLHLCDMAVILACAGFWWGSPLLISSQAVSSLLAGILWCLDVGWKLATGRYLVGGTEYMWDAHYPLGVRLLSLFHIGMPIALLCGLRRMGYDRRGLATQSGIAAGLLIVSRFLPAALNLNYAYQDPLLHRAWGPAPVHLAVTLLVLVAVLYLPTHLLLKWFFRAPSAG
jgi:hypothetical protein